jgi:hypothetical protein
MNTRKGATLAAIAVAVGLFSQGARGADTKQLHEQASAALTTGAYQEAIDALELLSDRGFVNSSVSFNRALAYLGRANSPQSRNGDLGQSVAALEEVQLLDPDDGGIAPVLEQLRKEIAREQAKRGSSPLVPRPTLGRAIVSLCQENTWFLLAAVGSGLITLSLALWFWIKATPAQITAMIAGTLGVLLALFSGSMAYAARQLRLEAAPAVVIASSARLLDSVGTPMKATSGSATEVSEGALVDVLETRGALTHISWGGSEGWVSSAYLRRLARP